MRYSSLIIILLIATFGCQKKTKQSIQIKNPNYLSLTEIADTIITDVVIKNPDQDEWTDYRLRNLDKQELVEQIFKLVYSGELDPLEFFNETPLSIDEIKALEKEEENLRERVGKVQFEEAWYFDSETKQMIKRVHSIMLAYEFYDSDGKVRGYKPIFKVYLNK